MLDQKMITLEEAPVLLEKINAAGKPEKDQLVAMVEEYCVNAQKICRFRSDR